MDAAAAAFVDDADIQICKIVYHYRVILFAGRRHDNDRTATLLGGEVNAAAP